MSRPSSVRRPFLFLSHSPFWLLFSLSLVLARRTATYIWVVPDCLPFFFVLPGGSNCSFPPPPPFLLQVYPSVSPPSLTSYQTVDFALPFFDTLRMCSTSLPRFGDSPLFLPPPLPTLSLLGVSPFLMCEANYWNFCQLQKTLFGLAWWFVYTASQSCWKLFSFTQSDAYRSLDKTLDPFPFPPPHNVLPYIKKLTGSANK